MKLRKDLETRMLGSKCAPEIGTLHAHFSSGSHTALGLVSGSAAAGEAAVQCPSTPTVFIPYDASVGHALFHNIEISISDFVLIPVWSWRVSK